MSLFNRLKPHVPTTIGLPQQTGPLTGSGLLVSIDRTFFLLVRRQHCVLLLKAWLDPYVVIGDVCNGVEFSQNLPPNEVQNLHSVVVCAILHPRCNM